MTILYSTNQVELSGLSDEDIRQMMAKARSAVTAIGRTDILVRIVDGLRYQLGDTPTYAPDNVVRHIDFAGRRYQSVSDPAGFSITRPGCPHSPSGYKDNR